MPSQYRLRRWLEWRRERRIGLGCLPRGKRSSKASARRRVDADALWTHERDTDVTLHVLTCELRLVGLSDVCAHGPQSSPRDKTHFGTVIRLITSFGHGPTCKIRAQNSESWHRRAFKSDEILRKFVFVRYIDLEHRLLHDIRKDQSGNARAAKMSLQPLRTRLRGRLIDCRGAQGVLPQVSIFFLKMWTLMSRWEGGGEKRRS